MKNDVLFKAIKQILWFIQDLNPVLLAPSLTCALHHILYRSITYLLTVLFSLLLGSLPSLHMFLNHQSLLKINIQRHHPTITHIHDPPNHNLRKIPLQTHRNWFIPFGSTAAVLPVRPLQAERLTRPHLEMIFFSKLCKKLEFRTNKELPFFSSSWKELTLVNQHSVLWFNIVWFCLKHGIKHGTCLSESSLFHPILLCFVPARFYFALK